MAEEIGRVTGSGVTAWQTLSEQTHETNPDLIWPASLEVFDKMRREDSQVGSVLRAVTLPIRRAKWVIDPAGARQEVVALIAGDLGLPVKGEDTPEPTRRRGRFSWEEHLRLALLELVFGHSFFEQVYRPEGNRLHLAKLAWRPPRTIAKVNVAKDGGLESIEQHGVKQPIPVDRLVAYVNEREGGNWFGQSLLRTAYKNWLLKDRLLRIQALTAERNGLGLPTYTGAPPPDGLQGEAFETWRDSEKQAGLDLAKGVRAGDAAGASLPHGAELEFKGVTGDLPDTDAPIRYHDEQIARAVLAHFLNLGTETGSWALGSTFANFFTDSLNAVSQQIADIAQQHIIEDLVDWNWGPGEPAPRLIPATIGSDHPITAESIKALVDAKVLTADETLEAHVRGLFGLPTKPDTTNAARDTAQALEAVAAVQKVYLGVGVVLTADEARELVRRAGAGITGSLPAADPGPTLNPQEGA